MRRKVYQLNLIDFKTYDHCQSVLVLVLVLIIEGNCHLLKKVRPILLVEVEEHFTVTVCGEGHLEVGENEEQGGFYPVQCAV